MEFIKEEKLPGLKLYLEENNENVRRWFLFEEAFQADTLEGVGSNIVGSICIYWQERIIDFHVNNHILLGEKKNYQGKGYGTMIMHYIETEMLPDFPPDFKITNKNCRGEDKFSIFKQCVEEKIRSSLNVLVIGVDDDLVCTLKAKGYKKVYNIKSYVAAIHFLEENIAIASSIHLVFLKRFSDENVQSWVREHLDAIFSYQSEKYNSYLLKPIDKKRVHFHYWENEIPRIFFYSKPFFREDNEEVQYYSISSYDWVKTTYSSYISDVEKQLFPLLQVSHLKKEELPIFLPSFKEKEVKKLEDLRILFLTRGENYSYFKEYLQEKGITRISLFKDSNFSYSRNALNQLGDYDLIIASDIFSCSLLSNYLEAKEQAKLCGRETILLACYDEASVYDGLTLDNSVKYCLIDKEEVIKRDYVFRMLYDDKNSLQTHRDYEYVVVRIAETIIREYLDYINTKGASIPCEQFSSYQQLNNQSEDYIKKILLEQSQKAEEQHKKELFCKKFDTLRDNLLRYLRVSQENFIEEIKEVSVEEKREYIRVCFLIKGVNMGAISIPKREQENGRICIFELPGKSGLLLPGHTVCFCPNEEGGDPSYDAPTEKVLQFINGICKRVDTYINPVMESILANFRKSFAPRKSNKKV